MCPEDEIPRIDEKDKRTLATKEEIAHEVAKRRDPENYSHLWGRPLKEVRDEITEIGRPLAPQSIEALTKLFESYGPAGFDEAAFAEKEMEADARLYRDPRFRAGLVGTLEQKVTDYRL
jgi:hypothetical protein